MGSKRLPGKVLLPLDDHTVLAEVLTRCNQIDGVDRVVCAIPNTAENDVLVPVIEACNLMACSPIYCCRGPEDDVLERYFVASLAHSAEVVVRITADCPLLSWELCSEVIMARQRSCADYASNIKPRTFPRGLDCEVFTHDLLCRANAVTTGEDREHVTPWMQRAKDVKRAHVGSPWHMDGRLCLDTEDDYKVICAAFGHEPYQHL